ncbi:MAG TPA: MarR family transcriptional regulator [Blastocatellia bacterium]|nr:MarR family transcriptional regulator [Blastocatellia bacterium]
MATETGEKAEVVLENFVEAMFRMMMENHHRQIAELELTGSQILALRLLRQGPLCTGELATALRISAPAVTQLTDRLARKSLIERRQADGDRRSVIVALTARGRRAVDRVRECRTDIFCGALAYLGDRDREMVVLALGKMVSALERYEAQTADGLYGASKSHSRPRKEARA